MANLNAPSGLVPVQRFGNAAYRNSGTLYYIPASYGSKIGLYDAVTRAAGADSGGIGEIALTAAGGGNAITGSVIGWLGACAAGAGMKAASMYGLTPGPIVRPASTALDYYAFVDDDPLSEFVIQENDDYGGVAGTPLPVSAVGLNANIVYAAPNNFGQSGTMLDANTVAATQNLQLKIKSFLQSGRNTAGAAYAKVIVQINQHTEANNVAGD